MPPHLERLAISQVSSGHIGGGYQPWRRRLDESGETKQAGGRPSRHGFTVSTCYATAAGCARQRTDASAVCYGLDRL